jgi:plastocyanin
VVLTVSRLGGINGEGGFSDDFYFQEKLMRKRAWMAAVVICAGVCGAAGADVTGKVTLDGKAPKAKEIKMTAVADCAKQHADPVYEETWVVGEKNELKNVIVYVQKADGVDLSGPAPSEPAVLDQKACMYVPHVLPVMVGQKMQIKNDDPFLHNIHGLGKDNGEFNFPQQNKGDLKEVTGQANKAPERYKVKCDVHPWMGAWIMVLDHPYFATTGDDGTYTIKGLKDGDYTLVAWHEKGGATEQKISVKDGKATADFKVKMKSGAAMGPADPNVKEIVVSAKGSSEKCEDCCEGEKTAKTTQVVAKK